MLIHVWIKNLKCSKQIQYLLEQKNCSKEKSMSKNIFHVFTKRHFEKFKNKKWTLQNDMEIKL